MLCYTVCAVLFFILLVCSALQSILLERVSLISASVKSVTSRNRFSFSSSLASDWNEDGSHS